MPLRNLLPAIVDGACEAMPSSSQVRLLFAVVLLGLMASVAGCGGSSPKTSGGSSTASGTTTSSRTPVQVTPSGFVVQPDIADPLCNAGRGVRLPARLGGDPVLASATMVDGSTLIALSEVYPGSRSVVLQSITRACVPNRELGAQGATTITIPSRLLPAHPPAGGMPPAGLWVNVVAPRRGGGAIVAGTFGGAWVVGEVTARGRIDPTFASRGWTVFPFNGEVTAVLQEPSGRIVIAGDNNGGGCCNLNWAAAVSGRGQFQHGFGTHGRQELPTGEDSGVDALALEPNGDVLVTVSYGSMGCWGVTPAMLLPSGRPVPGFTTKLRRFWHQLGFGAFVGNAYTDGDGFTLIGTGQQPCVAPPYSAAAPSSTGLIARFRPDGEPVGRTIRFPSRLYGDGEAFPDGNDTFLVGAPSADSTQLRVTAHRPDGSIDSRFGSHGRVLIHTPWRGKSASLFTQVSITKAGPHAVTLIATRFGLKQLQIVRIHF